MLKDGSDKSELDSLFAEILKTVGEAAKCSRALENAVDEIVTCRGRDISTVAIPEEIEPEHILKESNKAFPDNTIAEYLYHRVGDAMEIEHMFEGGPPRVLSRSSPLRGTPSASACEIRVKCQVLRTIPTSRNEYTEPR